MSAEVDVGCSSSLREIAADSPSHAFLSPSQVTSRCRSSSTQSIRSTDSPTESRHSYYSNFSQCRKASFFNIIEATAREELKKRQERKHPHFFLSSTNEEWILLEKSLGRSSLERMKQSYWLTRVVGICHLCC